MALSSIVLVGANLIVSTAADSGAGSLREAIDTANASPEDDVIDFDPGLAGQTIGLRTSATVPVDRDYGPTAFYVDATGGALTIRWDRAHGRAPRLDAGGERRHFVIDVGGSLHLEGMWLSNGRHQGGEGTNRYGLMGGGAAGMGGSIFVREGALFLVDALLTDSAVRGGDGGAGGSPEGGHPGGGGGGLAGDGAGTNGGPPSGGGFGGGGNGAPSDSAYGVAGGFGGGGGGGGLFVPGSCCGPGCDPGSSVYQRGGDGGFGGGAGSSGASAGFGGGTFSQTHGGGGAALGGAVFVVGGTVSATQVTWAGHSAVAGRRGGAQARGVALAAVDSTVTLLANTFQYSGNAAEGAVLVVARDGATASLTIDHTLVVSSSVPAVQTAVLGTGVVTVEGAGNFIEGGAPDVAGSTDPGDVELAWPADHGGGLPAVAVTTDAFVGDCPTLVTDARGVPRPATGCDAGAFQRATTCATDDDCANGATCEDGFCCSCGDVSPSWCAAALGAPADGVCTEPPAGAVCDPGPGDGPDARTTDAADPGLDGGGGGGCGCASSQGGAANGLLVLLVATAASWRRRRRDGA